jgi:hypothetical protein
VLAARTDALVARDWLSPGRLDELIHAGQRSATAFGGVQAQSG